MSFQNTSQEQILPLARLLDGLQQGLMVTIVITNAPGPVSLEFKHADDPDWRIHPNFSGVPDVNGVILQTVMCVSATMRLNFESAPGADYYVSLVWHEAQE